MKLFITGTFRSGTTLISQMLNVSREIKVTYDSVHFMRFAYMRYGKNALNLESALRLGRDIHERLVSRFKRGFDLKAYEQSVGAIDVIRYSHLYDLIMRLYVGSENWGEKTVLEWRNAPDILEQFEDIFILHCIRDPRDVLCSWKNETIAPGVDYLDAIPNCFDSMKCARENERRFPARYRILQFEHLIREPERTLKSLCEGVGLAYDPDMLDPDRYRGKVTRDKWKPNTAFKDPIEGISRKPEGRWREHIEKEDLILCEWVNRDRMKEFGYELSGLSYGIREAYAAFQKLARSPLAYGGVLNVIHAGEGVMRNPVNHFDPSTWEKDVEKL